MTLKRCPGQEVLAAAASHPNAEEANDYEKYLEEKEAKVKDVKDVNLKPKEVFLQWLPDEKQKGKLDPKTLQYKDNREIGVIHMPPHINYG